MGEYINLLGEKYGMLTVIARAEDKIDPKSGYHRARWLCECQCGNRKVIQVSSLKSGNTKSCGCLKKKTVSNLKTEDLSGQRFGKLLVLERAENIGIRTAWKCRCDCGNEIIIKSAYLKKTTRMCSECKKNMSKVHRHNFRFIDLTGRVFGKLTVEYEAGFNESGKTIWHCKCQCGNECDIIHGQLLSGRTRSCGCLSKGIEVIDLTGKKFGRLTVLKRSHDKYLSSSVKRTMWLCQCECGNQTECYSGDLRTGNTKSCGCLKKETTIGSNNYNFKDLTGQTFGKLTVQYLKKPKKGKNGRSKVMWHCLCECGNEKDVHSVDLIHGHAQSCGCLIHTANNFEDLSGQRFNNWTVLNDYEIENQKTMWFCQCDCGTIRKVWAASLKNGASQSCGCIKSGLEQNCIKYFNEMGYKSGVDYEAHVTFADLRDKRGLSYDFLIYKNGKKFCLIECQGRQHYESIDFFGGEEQFLLQQEHDRMKRDYAKLMCVPLLEISFAEDSYEKVKNILCENGI